MFELRYHDSGCMHFSFFMIQFFRPTQKTDEQKQFLFFLLKVKNDFNMMRISFLLKQLCFCCLDVRLFSLILIAVCFDDTFQLHVPFLSVH